MADVDCGLNPKVLKYNLDCAKRRVLAAVQELRDLCDLVEGRVKLERSVNKSSSTSTTELFNDLGRYETLLDILKLLEDK